MMQYLFILFLLLIIFKAFQPKIKGMIGEKSVARKLEKLPENEYVILNDILLKTDRGTTQIDHVVLSVYGIFVIETKNYKGWITGNEKGEYWTQNIYGNKHQFKNPIRQNYGHQKALEALFDEPVRFIPIVAFSTEADLKVHIEKEHVIYIKNIVKCIKQLSVDKCYDMDQVRVMKQVIEKNQLKEKQERKDHITNTRKNIKLTNEKIKGNICPRCGGTLVLRKGKYGTFYGCSNYPKCRYTINTKNLK